MDFTDHCLGVPTNSVHDSKYSVFFSTFKLRDPRRPDFDGTVNFESCGPCPVWTYGGSHNYTACQNFWIALTNITCFFPALFLRFSPSFVWLALTFSLSYCFQSLRLVYSSSHELLILGISVRIFLMQWFPLAFYMIVFRHTVGLLWMSDQPVSETSTYTG
jgi:hypothetical protein